MAKKMYCLDCEVAGSPKRVMPGSIGVEVVLWLCFLVPGLIYSVWRHGASYQGCPTCGSKAVVPADSPRAKAALKG